MPDRIVGQGSDGQRRVGKFQWEDAIAEAVTEKRLPGSLIPVVWALQRHMRSKGDLDGVAWPSLPTLAAETQQHRTTVVRHLDMLVEAGWLRRRKGGGKAPGGGWRSTVYEGMVPVQQSHLDATVETTPTVACDGSNSRKIGLQQSHLDATRTREPERPEPAPLPPTKRPASPLIAADVGGNGQDASLVQDDGPADVLAAAVQKAVDLHAELAQPLTDDEAEDIEIGVTLMDCVDLLGHPPEAWSAAPKRQRQALNRWVRQRWSQDVDVFDALMGQTPPENVESPVGLLGSRARAWGGQERPIGVTRWYDDEFGGPQNPKQFETRSWRRQQAQQRRDMAEVTEQQAVEWLPLNDRRRYDFARQTDSADIWDRVDQKWVPLEVVQERVNPPGWRVVA